MFQKHKAIIIGGSAGSFQIVTQIVSSLPKDYKHAVILTLHRLKHVRHGFVDVLSQKSNLPVIEPLDKENIRPGKIYLAPSNYHLYIEIAHTFSLSTEDVVNHSRPSIDLTFMTGAYSYRERTVGIILSGANKDGAHGLKRVKDYGGIAIVQDPQESQVSTMPGSALEQTKVDHIFKASQIVEYLISLNN